MADLTRAEVQHALQQPIGQDENGWHCRICPRTFPHKNSIAVHELTHRRAVGLAPPQRIHKASKYVVCGYEGCTDQLRRTSLPPHLRGKKHGLSQSEASFYAHRRAEQDSHPAVLVEPEDNGHVSPLTDISAVEAVTGILAAARTDGVVPTRLLPAIHGLVVHTDAVLDELRRLTG